MRMARTCAHASARQRPFVQRLVVHGPPQTDSVQPVQVDRLIAGEVGYMAASIKAVADARVGDTITQRKGGCTQALPGYEEAKPMVFCGLFPIDADRYEDLREALGKLQLNDAALQYEPEVRTLFPLFCTSCRKHAAYIWSGGAAQEPLCKGRFVWPCIIACLNKLYRRTCRSFDSVLIAWYVVIICNGKMLAGKISGSYRCNLSAHLTVRA